MTLFFYTIIGLAAVYVICLLVIIVNTQKVCECAHCRTDMHLERTNRLLYVRRLYDYLPLKYFRCRRCHRTFYLHKNTPDSEPQSMKETAPKPKASYT